MEIQVEFRIGQKAYAVFISKKVGKKADIHLFEQLDKSKFMNQIPVKISTSTYKEKIEYWLTELQRDLAKQRSKKHSQTRSRNFRNGTRSNI